MALLNRKRGATENTKHAYIRGPYYVYSTVKRSSSVLVMDVGCVPTRAEKAVRVLLLGKRDQGRLVYKGKVGHSLTRPQWQRLLAELVKAPSYKGCWIVLLDLYADC